MTNFTVTTVKARELFASAHVNGTTVPRITQAGWGTGGSSGGNPIDPTATQTVVAGELLRNAVTASFFNSTTPRYELTLSRSEGNGNNISSVGLYDALGNLILIKNFAPRPKDNETEIRITIDEIF